jgi:hypothetical protein
MSVLCDIDQQVFCKHWVILQQFYGFVWVCAVLFKIILIWQSGNLVLLELSTHIWIVDDTLLLILQHKGFIFLSKVMSISLQILSNVCYSFLGNIYY